jgi:hypothetical protein
MIRLVMLASLALGGCALRNFECQVDTECDPNQVCARDHACVAPSTVRAVITRWTINGEEPDGARCGDRQLYIQFRGEMRDDMLAFSPVACAPGQFSIDKLPARFTAVELGVEGSSERITASIGSDERTELDLNLDLPAAP